MGPPSEPLADALLERAARGDLRGAMELAASAADRGRADEVLAAAVGVQRLVGERWYAGAWTVADEHATTAVVDAAVAAVESRCPPPAPTARTITVSCAPGEWHSLPGRVLCAELRRRGADVRFLGASVPADQLAAHARAARPHLVALSCSTALSLVAARDAVDAVHAVGIPVVVGGSAVAPSPTRWRRLGAAGGADDAEALLDGAFAVPDEATHRPPGPGLSPHDRTLLVHAIVERLRTGAGPSADRLTPLVELVVASADASAVLGDLTILERDVGWLAGLAADHGGSAGLAPTVLGALAEAADDPGLVAAAHHGLASLTAG